MSQKPEPLEPPQRPANVYDLFARSAVGRGPTTSGRRDSGGTDDSIGKLQVAVGRVEVRLEHIDGALADIRTGLRRIENKTLNRWGVALMVLLIMVGLGAAVVWGPRALAYILNFVAP